MSDLPQDLMTIQEAATRARVSVKTLRRAAQRGDLPVVHVGRLLRVRPVHLSEFYDRHTTTGAESEEGR